MRPLHLNLASRPYRDYRPVYAVVVITSLLIAFLMLNNIDTYYRYVRETGSTRNDIAKLDQQTKAERDRADRAEAVLRTSDLGVLNAEARYINARLAERAFSWSELLERLERVLPADVRIRSISPSFTQDGALIHLELACEAKAPAGLVDTINAFHKDSAHFTNPFPRSESLEDDGSIRFSIGVDFKPTVARMGK